MGGYGKLMTIQENNPVTKQQSTYVKYKTIDMGSEFCYMKPEVNGPWRVAFLHIAKTGI